MCEIIFQQSRAEQNRNQLIDIIKGVAILLVVVGHNIQYGSDSSLRITGDFFEYPLFKFIYSFHMPLFALVSGYLCHIRNNEGVLGFLIRKIKAFFVPVLSWVCIEFLIKTIIGLQVIDSLKLFVTSFVSQLVYSYWFLWAMLLSSIAIWIFEKYFNCNIWIMIGMIIFSMFIPNKLNSNLYIYIFPYFLLGYIWQKRLKGKELSSKQINTILFVVSLVFCFLLMSYSYNSYIYTTQIYLFGTLGWKNQIITNLFRWIIGLVGSIFVIVLCYRIENRICTCVKDFLTYLGKNSLGIYIVSNIFNVYLYKLSYRIIENTYLPNEIIWCIETVLILILCLTICRVLKKSKILCTILLGGR